MLLKPIRLVTFDVTHTLLRFRLPLGQQYGEAAETLGIKINSDVIARNFKTNFKKISLQYPNFGKTDNVSWEDWWRIVVSKTFENDISDNILLETIATNLIESYKTKQNWELNEGCKEILEYLKGTSVKLGIISNFDPRLIDILKNSGLYTYFDFILTSYDAGCMKPESAIFARALSKSKKVNINPCHALHIGDNVLLDYWGAKNSGWQAAIITNHENTVVKPIDIPTDHIFCSLLELKEFLYVNKHLFI